MSYIILLPLKEGEPINPRQLAWIDGETGYVKEFKSHVEAKAMMVAWKIDHYVITKFDKISPAMAEIKVDMIVVITNMGSWDFPSLKGKDLKVLDINKSDLALVEVDGEPFKFRLGTKSGEIRPKLGNRQYVDGNSVP
jgi:hypothetical protein